MSGLGVVKPKRVRQGKGIMSSLIKAVAPAIIDAAAGAVKGKVSTIGSVLRWGYRDMLQPSDLPREK